MNNYYKYVHFVQKFGHIPKICSDFYKIRLLVSHFSNSLFVLFEFDISAPLRLTNLKITLEKLQFVKLQFFMLEYKKSALVKLPPLKVAPCRSLNFKSAFVKLTFWLTANSKVFFRVLLSSSCWKIIELFVLFLICININNKYHKKKLVIPWLCG